MKAEAWLFGICAVFFLLVAPGEFTSGETVKRCVGSRHPSPR